MDDHKAWHWSDKNVWQVGSDGLRRLAMMVENAGGWQLKVMTKDTSAIADHENHYPPGN